MTPSQIEQILNLTPITLVNNEEVYYEGELLCKVESVSSWRMKYILQEDELLDQVDGLMQNIGGLALFAWENSLEIDRISGACEAIRIALGKSHEYVNELFERAKAIVL